MFNAWFHIVACSICSFLCKWSERESELMLFSSLATSVLRICTFLIVYAARISVFEYQEFECVEAAYVLCRCYLRFAVAIAPVHVGEVA